MSLFSLRRPMLNRTVYLILFASYIGLVLNIAFYRQAFTLLPVNGLHNWLVFLSMPIVAISVMNIITTIASFLKLDRLVISLFILLSASAQYFIWTFGVIIDRAMITNILDTTPAESFALLSGRMVLILGLTGVLAVVAAWWVKIRKTGNPVAQRGDTAGEHRGFSAADYAGRGIFIRITPRCFAITKSW